ncbi:putative adenylate cyclase regulatory protein [Calliphora vicina]|uniref:putative adenylate cyclase regulatory protein n=1 Tax=Calliphora vicina TaxID=7373 RepID=UPI00325C00AA
MNNYYERPQYRIIDELAYTEDNILVYNVFVSNLPKDATTENLKEIFQKFGEVVNVRLLINRRRRNCSISFADASVATEVLQYCSPQYFRNCRMDIECIHSIHQPGGQRLIELLSENSKNDSINDIASCTTHLEQNALIFTLNDDCLEHICKKLDLNDQINFALSCQRFCEILKMISRVEYQHFNTYILSQLTPFKAVIFLKIVGPQIKTLTASGYIYIDVKFLTLCTNVEKLKISNCLIHISNKLIAKMPLLNELDIDDIDLNLINLLKTLKNFKILNIDCNRNITGKNIHFLSGLEKLSLNGCENIAPWNFKKICQNLKKLQYLDIRDCNLLKTEEFELIPQHLLHLEILKISFSADQTINCIAQLPKLKHLEIKYNEMCTFQNIYFKNDFNADDTFFKDLGQQQAEQLEELKLTNIWYFSVEMAVSVAKLQKLKVLYLNNCKIDNESLEKFSQLTALEELNVLDCSAITNVGVLQLLEHGVTLKRINLSICEGITPDLVNQVFKLLKEQRDCYLRTDLLHITLAFTYLCLIDEIGLEESPDVLKITLNDHYLVQHFDDSYPPSELEEDDFNYSGGECYDYFRSKRDYSD